MSRAGNRVRTDDLLITISCGAASVRLRCILLARHYQWTRLPASASLGFIHVIRHEVQAD
jgi:hypothetical protein